jgi:hypothetical protein
VKYLIGFIFLSWPVWASKSTALVEFIESKKTKGITHVIVNYGQCLFEIPTHKATDYEYVSSMIDGKCDPEIIYATPE